MGLTVDADHPGTPESAWSASGRLRSLPSLPLPAVRRALVVAPHPDDEVLGAGGLMQRLLARSVTLHVLAVTDGESSHPGSTAARAPDLAALRRQEVVSSLRQLGWMRPRVTCLGVPDGHVSDYEEDVAAAVRSHLDEGGLCIGPWSMDGHPDHDAVGRACAAASRTPGTSLVSYLVWAWHWADPVGNDLPWARLVRLELDPEEHQRKQRAVRAFRTQIVPLGDGPGDAPVLPPPVLMRFLRDFEVFVHDGGRD